MRGGWTALAFKDMLVLGCKAPLIGCHVAGRGRCSCFCPDRKNDGGRGYRSESEQQEAGFILHAPSLISAMRQRLTGWSP